MATLSDLVAKVRLELNDQPKQFEKTLAGDGTSTTFNLGVKPVDELSLVVKVDGIIQAQGGSFTLEPRFGVIHFVTPPANGAIIKVYGNVFRYFSTSEIEYFTKIALTQHTVGRTDPYGRQITTSSLPEIEVYPVVIQATIEALYALATDSAFDIDIVAPDGVTIPRSQRFAQLNTLIANRQQQYKELCAMLNIGIYRIEMGVLRRVSRTTNKLVPVYLAQEIDDSRRPERVYIQNDLLGRTPQPSTVSIYDIVLYQGDAWSAVFDFPDTTDFTDLVFKAEVRTYPGSPSLYATFNIAIVDAPTKKLRLSLTKKQTEAIPTRAFWDIQATSLSDDTFQRTYVHGQVFCERQVTQ